MTTALPICIVGAGLIGLRHVQVAQKSDAVKVTAVVEPDAGRRALLIDRGLTVVAQMEQVPNETRAAIIATPTPLHGAQTLKALERGWAVLVEKPLTGTLDEADAVIAAAAAAGVPVLAGHHRRCHPFSQAARRALAGIGAPVGVQALWAVRKHDSYFDVDWRRGAGAGPLMINLIHDIDLLRFLLGDIVEVSALTSNARRGYVVEDTAALSLRFACGALGSVLYTDAGASPWSFEQATGENPDFPRTGKDYLHVTGTVGALSFPSLTLWQDAEGNTPDWRAALTSDGGQRFDTIDPIAAQLDRFALVVSGAEDETLARAEDGRAALEMTLATVLSGQTGRPVRQGEVPGNYNGT